MTEPAADPANDPVRMLVRAVGMLPPDERDQVFAWLLHRKPPLTGHLARSTTMRAAQLQDLRGGEMTMRRGTEQATHQVVPVRFPSPQHALLREWCTEHGFSMATVIRGLVAGFLEGQLPERN